MSEAALLIQCNNETFAFPRCKCISMRLFAHALPQGQEVAAAEKARRPSYSAKPQMRGPASVSAPPLPSQVLSYVHYRDEILSLHWPDLHAKRKCHLKLCCHR